MAVMSSKKAKVTLPADNQIRIEREFDAPPEFVFKAYTTPELVERWWTANRGEATEVKIDLRVGGKWRHAMVTPDGFPVAFHGEYREIVPNERLVSTEVYEGADEAGATLNTATFAKVDGGTLLTILVEAPSKEVRDMIIESGMEEGLQDALTLLEEVALSEG